MSSGEICQFLCFVGVDPQNAFLTILFGKFMWKTRKLQKGPKWEDLKMKWIRPTLMSVYVQDLYKVQSLEKLYKGGYICYYGKVYIFLAGFFYLKVQS